MGSCVAVLFMGTGCQEGVGSLVTLEMKVGHLASPVLSDAHALLSLLSPQSFSWGLSQTVRTLGL